MDMSAVVAFPGIDLTALEHLAGIETLISSVDLTSKEDNETQESRDRMDAERADEMNRRFEDVVLNERAEEKFL